MPVAPKTTTGDFLSASRADPPSPLVDRFARISSCKTDGIGTLLTSGQSGRVTKSPDPVTHVWPMVESGVTAG